MTHDELLAKIDEGSRVCELDSAAWQALRVVVELHKPEMLHRGYEQCIECGYPSEYPCPTIEAIEKELK